MAVALEKKGARWEEEEDGWGGGRWERQKAQEGWSLLQSRQKDVAEVWSIFLRVRGGKVVGLSYIAREVVRFVGGSVQSAPSLVPAQSHSYVILKDVILIIAGLFKGYVNVIALELLILSTPSS